MKLSKDKYSNDVLTFTSNLNIDNGYTATSHGDHESEMTLHLDSSGYPVNIEWDNPVMYTNIGIEYDEDTKEVTGYDGVFEIPEQALYLLKAAGFKISENL